MGASGENHGRRTYKRDGQVGGLDVMLYFWDQRDGPNFCGWWFGPKVGGDQVWAYHNNKDAQTPPLSGWKVPYDGPVDPTLQLAVGGGGQQMGQQRSAGFGQQMQQGGGMNAQQMQLMQMQQQREMQKQQMEQNRQRLEENKKKMEEANRLRMEQAKKQQEELARKKQDEMQKRAEETKKKQEE